MEKTNKCLMKLSEEKTMVKVLYNQTVMLMSAIIFNLCRL